MFVSGSVAMFKLDVIFQPKRVVLISLGLSFVVLSIGISNDSVVPSHVNEPERVPPELCVFLSVNHWLTNLKIPNFSKKCQIYDCRAVNFFFDKNVYPEFPCLVTSLVGVHLYFFVRLMLMDLWLLTVCSNALTRF